MTNTNITSTIVITILVIILLAMLYCKYNKTSSSRFKINKINQPEKYPIEKFTLNPFYAGFENPFDPIKISTNNYPPTYSPTYSSTYSATYSPTYSQIWQPTQQWSGQVPPSIPPSIPPLIPPSMQFQMPPTRLNNQLESNINNVLFGGQNLENEYYKLLLDTTGNLSLNNTSIPDGLMWQTNTSNLGPAPYSLQILPDGNLTINNSTKVIWSSNTSGRGTGPWKLVVKSNGDVCVIDGSGQSTWCALNK